MEKVLFLDIDGVVLSGEELYASRNNRYLPPHKIDMVKQICDRSGAIVVVSSTWRHSDETRDALAAMGLPLHHDWRTPVPKLVGGLYIGEQRGHEIQHWLDAHPSVSSYVIIDDDSDMLVSQMTQFVKTPFHTGLESHHVERAVSILSSPA